MRSQIRCTNSGPVNAAVAVMMAMGRAMIEDADAKGLEGLLTNPIFG
jgi:hypothetical protein